ncbi:MAG: phospholipase D-like domain-containing protein, partial [Candidatus Methanofastidiosia archaeon]
SIYILMYSMKYYPEYPNDHNSKLLKALIDASKRGVDVMVILEISDFNNNLNQENTETAKYLKRNGVKVKFDSKYIQTHSKVLIVDKRIVVVGSTNWSYYAIDKNTEASVMIYSEEIGEEFAKYFLELWRKYLI